MRPKIPLRGEDSEFPRKSDRSAAIGVDGCRGGWVAVALGGGRVDRAWFGTSLATLLDGVPRGVTIGIDIPLGGVPRGWRTADVAAKQALGAQHASVFLVPPRPVWELADDYPAANARCRELAGAGLSRQSHGLLRRMLEAEVYRDTVPHDVVEVHPELVFRTLAGTSLPYGKKTAEGQRARRALLAGVGIVLDGVPSVPTDDVLDAAAVAWCAHRVATGAADHLPDPPDQHDHRGRPIVIWRG